MDTEHVQMHIFLIAFQAHSRSCFFHESLAEYPTRWWLLKIHLRLFFVAFLYRISEYMDLTPAEVVGHTCYHFIHVEDLENLRQSHEDRESDLHICSA